MLPSSNLGSLGDSARLSWGEGGLEGFDNEVRGSGRHGREHMSQCGQRASFNGAHACRRIAPRDREPGLLSPGYELIPFQLFGFPLFGMVLCR